MTLAEKLPRFDGRDDAALRALLNHATLRTLPENTIPVAEGDETDAVHLLLSGRLVDVYGHVVRTLQELAREEDGRQILPQFLSPQSIANLVGASREMVSRILKEPGVGGYICIEDRRIVVLRKPSAAP
jgi:CRP-like cAMP-binding protein